MDINKFLIIGSSSFSGSSFVNYLLKKKQDVIGISRSKNINNVFLPYLWNSHIDNFENYYADLNLDTNKIVDVIEDKKPDYIVNFAAQGMVAQSWEKPEDWYNTNVVSQVKLHNQIRKFDFIKKYIHVTTPEVYGSTDNWISENFNFSPSTPYAVSRASCDLHLMSFKKAYDFPVVFTRAANVYGSGQQLYRIIPRTILYSRLNKKLNLHGGGFSERSFIHIDDVASATFKIAIKGSIGETYHISTERTISIHNLVLKVCEILEQDPNELIISSEERLGKDQSYLLSSEKIRQELEWEDKIELESGIKSTIDWVDANLEVLKDLPHDYIHKS